MLKNNLIPNVNFSIIIIKNCFIPLLVLCFKLTRKIHSRKTISMTNTFNFFFHILIKQCKKYVNKHRFQIYNFYFAVFNNNNDDSNKPFICNNDTTINQNALVYLMDMYVIWWWYFVCLTIFLWIKKNVY